MAWYNSANEAKKKFSNVTGISKPSDVLDPIGRTTDAVGSIGGGVDTMYGTQGGMDTGGRSQVEPMKDQFGNDWEYGKNTTGQKTADQVAQEKIAADLAAQEAQKAEVRKQQSEQIAILQAAARGEGPSAAQDQLQLATDQNMRSSLAMAASSRGNPALAMQSADRQRAIIGQQQGAQAGALRAQEMQSAQAQLAQAIQSQRQQDIGLESSVEVARERIASAEKIAGMQVDMNKAEPKHDPLGIGMDWGELASVGVTAAMVYMSMGSDERLKTDIDTVTDEDVDEFFDSVIPKSFKYRNPEEPGQSAGLKVGLMAQDVRDTKLGKILFSDRDDGMSVLDPQVLMGIMMAGMKKIMKGQKHADV